MPPEELNDILLHAVLNGWGKQAYLQGLYFEMKSYKTTCDIFKLMEVALKIYEGGTPSKIPIRADSERASHCSKLNG